MDASSVNDISIASNDIRDLHRLTVLYAIQRLRPRSCPRSWGSGATLAASEGAANLEVELHGDRRVLVAGDYDDLVNELVVRTALGRRNSSPS